MILKTNGAFYFIFLSILDTDFCNQGAQYNLKIFYFMEINLFYCYYFKLFFKIGSVNQIQRLPLRSHKLYFFYNISIDRHII